ncbi:MAG TPA: hypothetical protein VFO25_00910 [Candidatus Eremiobacteraceae bacterium]|nr:hypothetical protein [Candidatus Eremiobacteraceae bacterium]
MATGTVFTAARAPHPMSLDPSLRDPAWRSGRVSSSGFWDLTRRSVAQFDTTVYMLYDDHDVYVAFHVEQSGIPIVAQQRTNNVGFGLDDFIGVAIDTSGAGNQVYFFETTPRAIRYQQSSDNVRYTPRWQSAASIDGGSWNAVLAIPLDAMRIRPGAQLMWRFNFIRGVSAVGEHYTWAYNGLMVDGPVGQGWPTFSDARYWPTFKIDGGIGLASRPRSHAEIYSLGSAGSDRDRFQQSDGTFRRQPPRPLGVDFTIPLTNTINAVGTIDPDFSNVEVDQQTIVPQEFPRQLQEYRPFFAQGANFLNESFVTYSSPTSPNLQVFYSPRIGPFDRGAKIEGTSGLYSLGMLSFRGFDRVTGNTFDDFVYAFNHALPDRTFQYWVDGVSAHHSVAGDDATTDIGAQGRDLKTGFQWGDDQTIELGSWVPDPRVARNSNTFVAWFKPNWGTAIGYNDMSPNYNPIDGLTFNSDIRGMQGFAQGLGSAPWAKNYAVTFNWDRWMDRSGAIHEADTLATLTATFNNGLSINNFGPSVGILRSYDTPANPDCSGPIVGSSSFTGFPCYLNGRDRRFDLFQSAFGYKDGTAKPIDASYSFGPFGDNYTQIFSLTTSRPIGRYSLGFEYDGTLEHPIAGGALDSQWLRRISIGESLGAESNLSISLRSINGLGGFAPSTGTDVALAFHRRFATGDELFLNYGTPAAFSTLHRLTLKYVLHVGGDAATR